MTPNTVDVDTVADTDFPPIPANCAPLNFHTCTLRDAVALAATLPGSTTVNVPSGTYALYYGEITLDDPAGLVVQGAGSSSTVVDNSTAAGVTGGNFFEVGTSSSQGVQELNGFTLGGPGAAGGTGDIPLGPGGAICQGPAGLCSGNTNATVGPLEMNNDKVIDSTSTTDPIVGLGVGGGAFLDGLAYLSNDLFSNDTAGGFGGGIEAFVSSDVVVNSVSLAFDSTTVASNAGGEFDGTLTGSGLTAIFDSAATFGGGLGFFGNTNLTGVTASDDVAAAESGGGISTGALSVVLTNVTAVNDAAAFDGGGLFSVAASLSITGGTFGSQTDPDTAEFGGGIWADDTNLTLTKVTADYDTATGDAVTGAGGVGGGIDVDFASDAVFSAVSTDHDTATGPASGIDVPAGGGTYFDGSNVQWNGGSASFDAAASTDNISEGGGVWTDATASNSTIGGVTIDDDIAGYVPTPPALPVPGEGGGLYNDKVIFLQSDDVSSNFTAGGLGSGVFDAGTGLSLNLTTVDNNVGTATIPPALEGGGIFEVGLGMTVSGGTVNGNTALIGGGIVTLLPTTLNSVAVNSNTAEEVGGIFNESVLQVNGGTISKNVASDKAGGVAGGLLNAGAATITGTVLSSNVASGLPGANIGGAIYNLGNLALSNTTIGGSSAASGNVADFGAGLANFGSAQITSSTFSYNQGQGHGVTGTGAGSAIYTDGFASLTNTTVANNTFVNSGDAAIYNGTVGTLDLTETTVANNSATIGAAGVDNENSASAGYSIFAGDKIGLANVECFSASVTPVLGSGGYNRAADTTCGLTGIGDKQGVAANPHVAALASNGGPTQTMAIAASSSAINVKVSSFCPTSYDQRGPTYKRPTTVSGKTGCDAGAYQLQ